MSFDVITNADVSGMDVTCACGFSGEVEVWWHGPVGSWTCPSCLTEYEVEL